MGCTGCAQSAAVDAISGVWSLLCTFTSSSTNFELKQKQPQQTSTHVSVSVACMHMLSPVLYSGTGPLSTVVPRGVQSTDHRPPQPQPPGQEDTEMLCSSHLSDSLIRAHSAPLPPVSVSVFGYVLYCLSPNCLSTGLVASWPSNGKRRGGGGGGGNLRIIIIEAEHTRTHTTTISRISIDILGSVNFWLWISNTSFRTATTTTHQSQALIREMGNESENELSKYASVQKWASALCRVLIKAALGWAGEFFEWAALIIQFHPIP